MRRYLLLALLGVVSSQGATLAEKLEALLDESALSRAGLIGVHMLNAETGRVEFTSNADRFFVPASNVKLFTTALALSRLGPDYRFRTRILVASLPGLSGRLAGSLVLEGGGDPNLSGRVLPYDVEATPADPLTPIEELADQIVRAGVRRIDGDIIGDDTAFAWNPYGEGWGVDDPLWEYGAAVSAISLNDNTIRLSILSGDPPRVLLSPPIDYFQIDNRLRLGKPQRIRIERDLATKQIRLTGTLPASGAGEGHILGIDDPALFAALALRDALTRRGVDVRGKALARHALAGENPKPAETVELVVRKSAALSDILQVVAKVSQNLHAEMMLRAVGRERRQSGTVDAGLAEMDVFLKESGILPVEYDLHDGSGLSRLNLVTPSAVAKLLRAMDLSPHREQWNRLLPVGGEDGTLQFRYKNTTGIGRVHAKTGTLTHITALGGYLDRKDGSRLVFSILANNQKASSSEVRALVDKLCLAALE